MNKSFFAATVLVTSCVLGAANAQDYIYGPSGTTYTQIGDSTFGSDGRCCITPV